MIKKTISDELRKFITFYKASIEAKNNVLFMNYRALVGQKGRAKVPKPNVNLKCNWDLHEIKSYCKSRTNFKSQWVTMRLFFKTTLNQETVEELSLPLFMNTADVNSKILQYSKQTGTKLLFKNGSYYFLLNDSKPVKATYDN